jgi:hypothetical protein
MELGPRSYPKEAAVPLLVSVPERRKAIPMNIYDRLTSHFESTEDDALRS